MATTANSSPDTLRTRRAEYQKIRAALWTERSSFDAHWRELADHILPRRARFTVTDRNKGDRRNSRIIDSTGTFAARSLRSGLHAGITSPARPWMRLTTPDPDLAEFGPVKQWLHTVTQRMLTVFLRSNLYNALPVVYGDLGVFGTGAMAVLEDDKDLLRCYPFPIGSYALGLNDRQICGTFVREYQLTVRQVIEGFAMNPQTKAIDWSVVSTNVKTLWDRQQYEQPIEICWIVAPNADADESRLGSEFLPFTSTYFERGSDKADTILKRSGYHEMPILAPRWEVSGEDTYGTDCPGMTVLGDIKALQIMQRRKAQAVELMINPSLQGPTHLRSQKVSLLPGDITYTDSLQNQEGLRPIREVRLSVAELTADIQDTRLLIRRGFYEDLFLMLAQTDQVQPITAREVQERHEEKLLALGPMLERMNDELLDPLVDRVFGIMSRAGIIPEPPQ